MDYRTVLQTHRMERMSCMDYHGLSDSAADSQNVSDDSNRPHVTWRVVLLRTQHLRSYKEGVDEEEEYHKVE